jgi:hypothetical protein
VLVKLTDIAIGVYRVSLVPDIALFTCHIRSPRQIPETSPYRCQNGSCSVDLIRSAHPSGPDKSWSFQLYSVERIIICIMALTGLHTGSWLPSWQPPFGQLSAVFFGHPGLRIRCHITLWPIKFPVYTSYVSFCSYCNGASNKEDYMKLLPAHKQDSVLVVSYSFQIKTFNNIRVNEHSTSVIKLNKTIQRAAQSFSRALTIRTLGCYRK